MSSRPSHADMMDAIEHADSMGDQGWTVADFDLKFLGNLDVRDLGQYDDLSSWMDFKPGEFKGQPVEDRLEELRSFRGPQWFERAKHWVKDGIPPIIVITAPDSEEGQEMTQIGDGRGRTNFAAVMDMKLPVWEMTFKGTKTAGDLATRVAARYKSKKKVKTQAGDDMTVYEYSDRQIANRNRNKAKKLEKLSGKIGKLRAKVKRDLKSSDPDRMLTALAVALMDHTYERVGNEESAKDGHVGVTGWQRKHLSFGKGKVTIKYVGKSGVKHEKSVTDSGIRNALRSAYEAGESDDACIFHWEGGKVTAETVNAYLKPFAVTAKDIRGFHANREMQERLAVARKGKLPEEKKARAKQLKAEFLKALEETAEAVGHEASTLRSQYLVPGLEESYLKDGTVMKKLGSDLEGGLAARVVTRYLEATMAPESTSWLLNGVTVQDYRDFAEACEHSDFLEPNPGVAKDAKMFRTVADALEKNPGWDPPKMIANRAEKLLDREPRYFRDMIKNVGSLRERAAKTLVAREESRKRVELQDDLVSFMRSTHGEWVEESKGVLVYKDAPYEGRITSQPSGTLEDYTLDVTFNGASILSQKGRTRTIDYKRLWAIVEGAIEKHKQGHDIETKGQKPGAPTEEEFESKHPLMPGENRHEGWTEHVVSVPSKSARTVFYDYVDEPYTARVRAMNDQYTIDVRKEGRSIYNRIYTKAPKTSYSFSPMGHSREERAIIQEALGVAMGAIKKDRG